MRERSDVVEQTQSPRKAEYLADPLVMFPKREARADGIIVQNAISGQNISFFVTNPHDAMMKYHYQGTFYEMEELEIIKRYLPAGGTFVDIGANVGNHAIYISRFSKASRIIVFEPNQSAVSVLKENLLLNRCTNIDTRFLGIALAAGKSRLKQLTPDPNNLGHTCYYQDAIGDVPRQMAIHCFSMNRSSSSSSMSKAWSSKSWPD